MCLIAFQWTPQADTQLILLANRDEMHARETAIAGRWPGAEHVFGGRDLKAGGSWMGVADDGRFAALTNVRDPSRVNGRVSRGLLVSEFLQRRQAPDPLEYAHKILGQADDYAGFNLLLGFGNRLVYLSNHPMAGPELLEPGVHAVSNAALNTPWPKLCHVREGLREQLMHDAQDDEALLERMGRREVFADEELPETGVGLAMERLLSPPFIQSPVYGTRASSLLRIGQREIHFTERRFDPHGNLSGESRHHQIIQAAD